MAEKRYNPRKFVGKIRCVLTKTLIRVSIWDRRGNEYLNDVGTSVLKKQKIPLKVGTIFNFIIVRNRGKCICVYKRRKPRKLSKKTIGKLWKETDRRLSGTSF